MVFTKFNGMNHTSCTIPIPSSIPLAALSFSWKKVILFFGGSGCNINEKFVRVHSRFSNIQRIHSMKQYQIKYTGHSESTSSYLFPNKEHTNTIWQSKFPSIKHYISTKSSPLAMLLGWARTHLLGMHFFSIYPHWKTSFDIKNMKKEENYILD